MKSIGVIGAGQMGGGIAHVSALSGGGVVLEGRDIGTVVFPDAAVKVFLTASEAERARRRAGDSEAGGLDVGSIAEQLRRRDHIDSTRETSPLTAAEDAVTIDTTSYDACQVIDIVLGLIEPA